MRTRKETNLRSLAKGITYRMGGTLATIFVAWAFTGDTTAALQIGALDFVVKILLYYLHERLWLHVSWGYSEILPRRYRVLYARYYRRLTGHKKAA